MQVPVPPGTSVANSNAQSKNRNAGVGSALVLLGGIAVVLYFFGGILVEAAEVSSLRCQRAQAQRVDCQVDRQSPGSTDRIAHSYQDVLGARYVEQCDTFGEGGCDRNIILNTRGGPVTALHRDFGQADELRRAADQIDRFAQQSAYASLEIQVGPDNGKLWFAGLLVAVIASWTVFQLFAGKQRG